MAETGGGGEVAFFFSMLVTVGMLGWARSLLLTIVPGFLLGVSMASAPVMEVGPETALPPEPPPLLPQSTPAPEPAGPVTLDV